MGKWEFSIFNSANPVCKLITDINVIHFNIIDYYTLCSRPTFTHAQISPNW